MPEKEPFDGTHQARAALDGRSTAADAQANARNLTHELESLEALTPNWPFRVHELYNRRAAIHAPYGGQQQGGIATPAGVPGIFIFTGHGARQVGYADRVLDDGTLLYTGEGQVGDMTMTRGNRAIRDHAADGKDLLLFEKGGNGQRVKFLGLYVCAGWDTERQSDTTGVDREAIVFRLAPTERFEAALTSDMESQKDDAPLSVLRDRAIAAATVGAPPTEAVASVYRRSEAVRAYVLSRANGSCEACGDPAPFITPAGRPFLEPHHIRRLSDGGPDHPAFVAAVCPNCHRQAHYGADRDRMKERLLACVAAIEAAA